MKISVALVAVILLTVGVFLYSREQREIPISQEQNRGQDQAVTWDSRNIEIWEGYYLERSGRGATEDPDYEYTCDTFVIKNDGPLVDYYVRTVERGNTINRKNVDGYLQFNLELSQLDTSEKLIIKGSNAQNLIKIEVQKKLEPGKGAHPCHSFVDILKVGL